MCHLLQNDGTPLVKANEVEGVLADVDPDRGDDSSYLLRCAHRACSLSFASRLPASVQQIRPLSTAGPSHYRKSPRRVAVFEDATACILAAHTGGLRLAIGIGHGAHAVDSKKRRGWCRSR